MTIMTRVLSVPSTKKSLFFSHNDPEIVKWLSNRKLDI